MSLDFSGRVAVITGAGLGLGRSHALLLGSLGASVVVNDLGTSGSGEGSDASVADQVVAEIKAAGGEAVSNPNSVLESEKIIECAMDHFGRVDVVVNNAGILRDKSFHKMSDDDWDLVYDVHLKGAFKVSRAAYKVMREQNYGRFVMTTSAAGIYGNFGQANYSACKLALHGLSQTISVEGASRGIRSNTIAPLAASRMMGTVMDEEAMAKLRPEAVSPLVAQLCHESCDSTGGLFEVSAGWMARVRWERSEGVYFSPSEVDVDKVVASWDAINDFSKSTHPASTMDSMKAVGANPHL